MTLSHQLSRSGLLLHIDQSIRCICQSAHLNLKNYDVINNVYTRNWKLHTCGHALIIFCANATWNWCNRLLFVATREELVFYAKQGTRYAHFTFYCFFVIAEGAIKASRYFGFELLDNSLAWLLPSHCWPFFSSTLCVDKKHNRARDRRHLCWGQTQDKNRCLVPIGKKAARS